MGTQLRGDRQNPYHLSVGGLISNDKKIALVKKSSGEFTLPRETIYLEETLSASLERGCREELGVVVKVDRFIGSLLTHFNRPDGTLVEKTTLYFTGNVLADNLGRSPSVDEVTDTVAWFSPAEALDLLVAQASPEADIIRRVVSKNP